MATPVNDRVRKLIEAFPGEPKSIEMSEADLLRAFLETDGIDSVQVARFAVTGGYQNVLMRGLKVTVKRCTLLGETDCLLMRRAILVPDTVDQVRAYVLEEEPWPEGVVRQEPVVMALRGTLAALPLPC